jgi:probable rRNA maturation factor
VNTRALRSFLDQLSQRLQIESGFTTVLVSDSSIQRYNRKFRGKDEATDVLAFPFGEEPLPGEEPYLGDILISAETAFRQKKGTLVEELNTLALHAVLHLLGYDHEVDRGEMEGLERQLRKELQLH